MTYKVLVIEDDVELGDQLRADLRAVGYQATLTNSLGPAKGAVDEARSDGNGFDILVIDRMLPDGDGAELIRRMRLEDDLTPTLLLTALGDVSDRIDGLNCGADDYLCKPCDPGELVARLRGHLRLKRLQDDLRGKNETLARLSTVDALTGLRTRRYVEDVLAIEFLRAQRYEQPLSILMADLDHFKRVNDVYGHLGGDAALRGVAQVLLHDLRATDVAGRYGGEEILVVLAHNEVSGARILAERWRSAVEESRFADPAGQVLGVTLSVGVASLDDDMASPEALVGAADAALYRAKSLGRNRVELAGPA